MDPWGTDKPAEVVVDTKFEDNFQPDPSCERLSDSAEYLATLERKLKAIRAQNKVVENLSAYRQDCIERLLREGCNLDPIIGDTEGEKLIQE